MQTPCACACACACAWAWAWASVSEPAAAEPFVSQVHLLVHRQACEMARPLSTRAAGPHVADCHGLGMITRVFSPPEST